MKKIFILLLFLVLSLSAPVLAGDQSSASPCLKDIVEDVLWIRPMGFVRLVLEAVAFGVSLPVTAPLKKVDEASEFLIKDPYVFVFERPIGVD